ncbi:3-methyladenine DNA glycosylase [Cellulomonas sp. PSBB021]|nr:3-methyladenine DNA glycosylase [Cellulomonas sp. PSBB021]ASR56615.1 3-methyladenine DNA glycosylase [Cellulomonas sp. PSBB021]
MLPHATWRRTADAHAARADAATAGHRERRSRHERHAIEDFLFEYYPTKPALLRRWHPGAGVALEPGPDGPAPHAAWRWYIVDDDGCTRLDVDAFLAERGETVRYVATIVGATAARPAATGCFGLHEWAMVYREAEHRHPLPLRLGGRGTDDVVEAHRIRCTHVDAFRFFTPDAAPRNTLQPTRETQPALEQPGCLHANMDLYKWALKLGPLVPGDLLLDCFELAREIRTTDMQASPYDVSSYGLEPVAIETPDGKAEYVRRQRDYAQRSASLRARLLTACASAAPTT